MTLFCPEQTMQRAATRGRGLQLALRAARLHDLAAQASTPRRQQMLTLMHKAYCAMGLAYWHRAAGNIETWFQLTADADDALDAARDVASGAINVPVVGEVAA